MRRAGNGPVCFLECEQFSHPSRAQNAGGDSLHSEDGEDAEELRMRTWAVATQLHSGAPDQTQPDAGTAAPQAA
jgi:hypothetical protein